MLKDLNYYNSLIKKIKKEVGKFIVGQEYMIDRILTGVFCGNHILIEGLPGLAKSSTVGIITKIFKVVYRRIQLTPDLLPSDIIGSMVYNQNDGSFYFRKGPIFGDIILLDEVNRAHGKVHSAVLEAMAEKQVTVDGHSNVLSKTFTVLATQNPIDHEGTYKLPYAMLDRFALKLNLETPVWEEFVDILEKITSPTYDVNPEQFLDQDDLLEIKEYIKNIYIDQNLKKYISNIVYKAMKEDKYLLFGPSIRGGDAIFKTSQAMALINGRDHVIPEDIKSIVIDALRHRVQLSYESEIEGWSVDKIIEHIVNSVDIP